MAADKMQDSKNSQEEKHDVLKSTQTVIHKALEKLGYPDEVYELLKEPLRMMTVKIPVRMDDGSVKILQVTERSITMQLVLRKAEFVFTQT